MRRKLIRPALLVIDVQNYFFDPAGPKYLKSSRAVVPRINRLLEMARRAGWSVIFTSHRAPKAGSRNLMAERYLRLPRGHECRIWREIEKPEGYRLIYKEHYSAFHNTRLASLLRSLSVREIILCGAMTHLCVDTTARHGFMLGFRPVIVSDACCSKSRAYHRAALLALGHGFADIVEVGDLAGHVARNDI